MSIGFWEFVDVLCGFSNLWFLAIKLLLSIGQLCRGLIKLMHLDFKCFFKLLDLNGLFSQQPFELIDFSFCLSLILIEYLIEGLYLIFQSFNLLIFLHENSVLLTDSIDSGSHLLQDSRVCLLNWLLTLLSFPHFGQLILQCYLFSFDLIKLLMELHAFFTDYDDRLLKFLLDSEVSLGYFFQFLVMLLEQLWILFL